MRTPKNTKKFRTFSDLQRNSNSNTYRNRATFKTCFSLMVWFVCFFFSLSFSSHFSFIRSLCLNDSKAKICVVYVSSPIEFVSDRFDLINVVEWVEDAEFWQMLLSKRHWNKVFPTVLNNTIKINFRFWQCDKIININNEFCFSQKPTHTHIQNVGRRKKERRKLTETLQVNRRM